MGEVGPFKKQKQKGGGRGGGGDLVSRVKTAGTGRMPGFWPWRTPW